MIAVTRPCYMLLSATLCVYKFVLLHSPRFMIMMQASLEGLVGNELDHAIHYVVILRLQAA